MAPTLLRQNSELARLRVWNWTLPAGPVTLDDGRRINVCPAADACLALCYARVNAYAFRNVRDAHLRNLKRVLDDLDGWADEMIEELSHRRHRANGIPRTDLLDVIDPADLWARLWARAGGSAVRIHDAGDFFSDDYLRAWLRIADETPDVLFYAYTKEVTRFRRVIPADHPRNLRWLFSLGGKEDHLLDLDVERHAEVFPDADALISASYADQEESDLLAVLHPANRIGIVTNNIPHLRRRMEGQTFGQIQRRRDERRVEIRTRRPESRP